MKNFSLLLILFLNYSFAQTELKKAQLENFKTTDGQVLDKAFITYRTIGKINKDSSNVILWPTWFTGTSKDVLDYSVNTVDTAKYYIIAVDAMGNGVSSSPSKNPKFPDITIRDMVNSQHELLTKHLEFDKVFAIMGISMGGMQALEWAVAYPEFSEKIISISGTPEPSFYDILVYQTMADLIVEAGDSKMDLNRNIKRAYDIFWMNAATPAFLNYQNHPDSLSAFRKQKYKDMISPQDYLSGLKAMIDHDIYDENNTAAGTKNKPETDILIIVSPQDRLVTPQNSISLAENWKSDLLILEGNCGHGAAWCEMMKIRKKISEFLSETSTEDIPTHEENSN